MSKKLLAIVGPLLLLCVLHCGRSESPEPTTEADYVEPIKAAFDEGEIGKPVDWNSLGGTDKAFLSALWDRDAAKAKAALAAGAKADLDCGHGCTALMLAAAAGDEDSVAAVRKAGAKETPEAEPYLGILKFPANAERPEYKAALREIAQLAGKEPTPGERAGAYRLDLGAEAAKEFLDKHHERLLNNGCCVFLYDQNFGLDGNPDVLWILPTQDKFAVMAFTGVNGINYDIDNHLVIRWMKRLEKDHQFLLTGCGLDFLSGRFITKLSDADAMARRMYAFCPDIVAQGTGSVDSLAKELRKTNEFYFWWD